MANPSLYPDVPISPGVPTVLRNDTNSINAEVSALSQDVPGLTQSTTSPQWGLFDTSGNQVITPTSVLGFEYKKTWNIPTYPQEQGAFQSYNKVELPGEPRMVLTKTGSIADRTTFLAQVALVAASLDLYVAYTPEYQWPSVNVIDFNILQRTAEQGATAVKVELILREVNVSATQSFSSSAQPAAGASATATRTPSGQLTQNTGPVQPQASTQTQQTVTQQAPASLAVATPQQVNSILSSTPGPVTVNGVTYGPVFQMPVQSSSSSGQAPPDIPSYTAANQQEFDAALNSTKGPVIVNGVTYSSVYARAP